MPNSPRPHSKRPVRSLIVTGTTGEASLLTFDERVKLMETAVKTAAGRKPVIAGTGWVPPP